jgi:ribosomal protein L32
MADQRTHRSAQRRRMHRSVVVRADAWSTCGFPHDRWLAE